MRDEDDPPEESRYLLPVGCKDLADVLQIAERENAAKSSGFMNWWSPSSTKTVSLCLLAELLETHLEASQEKAPGEDVFFIELGTRDYLAVWLGGLLLILRNAEWCADLDRVRRVADEQGITTRRENPISQGGTQLSCLAPSDPAAVARLTVTLLEDGFHLPTDLPIKYHIH